MNKSTTNLIPHFTGCASLAAIGVKIHQLDLLAPIRKLVHIPQKTVKDTPFEKVTDAFISMLTGATGVVELSDALAASSAAKRRS